MFLALIVFIFIISIIIFVHEFGHFAVAKLSGVKVEEFSIGFPPVIWKKKKGETQYSIGAVLFGGFNKIYGMDTTDEKTLSDPRSFDSQKIGVKLLIILGGVLMNIILAAIIFYFLLASYGFNFYQPLIFSDYKFPLGEQENFPVIAEVIPDSPAQICGLNPNDIIVAANWVKLSGSKSFAEFIDNNLGKEVALNVKNMLTREEKTVKVVPRVDTPQGEDPLGIAMGDVALLSYKSLGEKSGAGFLHSFNFIHYSFVSLGRIIEFSIQERTAAPLASAFVGPVGIFAVTKIIAAEGIYQMINLLAVISLALAITNILPIPALDGAKGIFIFLQAIDKKRFSQKLQLQIEQAGMVFIILLAVFLVFKDFFQFKDIIF
ncbi:MAG: hypothetical protein CO144_00605 [Candidatus Nealsonbacteria bacterium CG_4_9_14_3_um_filter_35_11]|uniref:PDZ domain-containing protein n=2 Tax=Candidatus Nealsoniibacteriota TaxID=1817911 RepID=A0A2M7DBC5_9BACT|nr:MAG: hypothetical protein COV62_00110 [Candidatus Nealsonbacteria bacterium CG11_big_fil_rev_8_21_14_0_20_35_11]PIV45734.1 MAG: hypothetical protein COS24_00695 [Candidatus Nealsonbacteria bacterium CG02_land_8_20_14_3_00_34_20]PIW92642.1 MAG: hypothetical protein COZ88_01120 [Candidatus Nealsonbacteria bacterium CG_4_8_14_3_um_filter_34_13]PIZ90099.1 MAG: hypothetical protein COX88_00195 [Candidatus Nealsonbacteria bacterium CG_4_10_14_0_2_um_filter_35_20]PJA84770.1 MAG: hypothetical protei